MEGLTLRPLTLDDVAAVAAITRASPEAAQWSDAEFARIARGDVPETQAWVAEAAGHAVGFVVTRRAADEVEILNLAVKASQRGRGVGGQLVEHALAEARAAGASRAFLEVRESNRGANELYTRNGFHLAGRREKYYTAPVEAALVLRREL